jgi:alkanesulfonate monooxygenase SsuD/methylene tetrahydromethanopterin reductase-like flavin-dependent oxidoreductase (luciferase family)
VTPRLSFSLWPSPERDWDELRGLAQYADSAKWHCLWYADHFMPNTGDASIIDGDVYECWSVIAAITAITSRLRIGSLVSPTTVRHPAVLAKTAATIDRLGRGRLVLGIGAGWQINEHRAYGIDLLEAKDRVDRFEEAIRIVRSLLDNETTAFTGKYFSIADAPCQPRPIQSPLPILVGTGGPRMSRITVMHADEWNTWGDVKGASERLAVIRRACESIDRDPATLRTSAQALFFLVDDPATAAKIIENAPSSRPMIVGDAHHIASALMSYHQEGFDEIIIPDFTLGPTPSARREMYERFETEVLPLVS